MKHILKSVYASYIKRVLMVGLFSTLLAVEVQAVGPDITCNSDPVIFNTGYDGMGGKLAVGATDAFWEAGIGDASGPASVTTWSPTPVIGNVVPTVWANSPYGNAEWVASSETVPSAGIVYYRYRFMLAPSVAVPFFALRLDFYVDDTIQQFIINGTLYKDLVDAAHPNGQGGYAPGSQLQETLNRHWVTGQNELIIKSLNAVGPTGLLVQSIPQATCLPAIQLTKTATSTANQFPNGTVEYTVTVASTTTTAVGQTVVSDALSAGLASGSWTCAVGSGAAVCPNASGTLPLNETIAMLPGESSLVYTIIGQVGATPPATITNTVMATPPPGTLCAPSGTESPCTTSVTTNTVPSPTVQLTKTASTANQSPNGTVNYTVTVASTTTTAVGQTVVSDALSAGLASGSWTCAVGSGTAVCPNASGTLPLNETIAMLPGESSLVYTITAQVGATPPATITNTVMATPPPGTLCAPNGTAPPCTTSITTGTIIPPIPDVRPVPTLSQYLLLILAGLMVVTAWISPRAKSTSI